ncbi:hypothetical protein HID58_013039, partial [Brassica napus]
THHVSLHHYTTQRSSNIKEHSHVFFCYRHGSQEVKQNKRHRKASTNPQEMAKNINNNLTKTGSGSASKSIKFLKRTLSFTDVTAVPKGYLAVSVGKEEKRYKIPTDYLSHQAFHALLREAEEEFGFQQAGVLKIPCEVAVFESILKIMEDNKTDEYLTTQECRFNATTDEVVTYRHPSDCPRTPSLQPHSPMCR